MSQSRKSKPKKPYADFPLTAHRNGQWCKKIRGKVHYFGTDADAALEKYLDERDTLQAGRTPASRDGLTVAGLCNHYLEFKESLVSSGELSPRTFHQYLRGCRAIVDYFGRDRLVDDVRPEDFTKFRSVLAKGRGVHALGGMICVTRMVFLFGQDEGLIEKHVQFGKAFKPPSKKSLRRSRRTVQQKHGKRMFQPDKLKLIIDECGAHLRAMVYLGINCGFGQTDCANLPFTAVDRRQRVIEFPRPKPETERRCFLWPESLEALNESISHRPEFDNDRHADLIFITRMGNPWVRHVEREGEDGRITLVTHDRVASEFDKVLRRLKLKRRGLNFYALRHTFETIAGEMGDQVAVNAIMGHVDDSMSAIYREEISDERLRNVTDHVRAWLFPKAKAKPERGAKAKKRKQVGKKDQPPLRVVG